MKVKGLRWVVLGMIMLVSIINYLDRGTLSYMWVANKKIEYTADKVIEDQITKTFIIIDNDGKQITAPADRVKKLESGIKILSQCLNDLHFRGAIGALRSLWVLGNEYISQKEPWKVIRTDENAAFITLVHCVHLMRLFAIISFPFIPFSSEQILKILHDQNHTKLASTPFIDGMNFHYFHRMHSIEANAKLFTKIESAEASGLSEKFAGNLRPRS